MRRQENTVGFPSHPVPVGSLSFRHTQNRVGEGDTGAPPHSRESRAPNSGCSQRLSDSLPAWSAQKNIRTDSLRQLKHSLTLFFSSHLQMPFPSAHYQSMTSPHTPLGKPGNLREAAHRPSSSDPPTGHSCAPRLFLCRQLPAATKWGPLGGALAQAPPPSLSTKPFPSVYRHTLAFLTSFNK